MTAKKSGAAKMDALDRGILISKIILLVIESV
jgi:hypothetical protein